MQIEHRITNSHMIKFAAGVSRAPTGSPSTTYSDKVADSYRNLYSASAFSISNLNE